MYIIAVYDVKEKRVGKTLKLFRQYLVHIQRSVFEGVLTEAQLMGFKEKVKKLLNEKEDSVIYYEFSDDRYLNREIYGLPPRDPTDTFL
jgi:CRISPR-associated protein Cas2